jgi:F0F1-type ATP synthase membrane subunit c/vacuolar-type H+-ATPase subunit K
MLETLWRWPWPWGYLPENPMLASSTFFGLVLVALGLLYVVGGGLSSERGPLARFVSLDVASWLTTGLVVGLALGLVTSLGFDLVPGSVGKFILPDNLFSGLAMGLGCSILFGCALGRLSKLPPGLVLGAAVGIIIGLAAFRRIFGPTSGFGPETDDGVGTDVGLAFGLISGLAGALVGVLIGRLLRVTAISTEGQRRRNWLAIGLLIGAVVSLAAGVVGWITGALTFTLPYYGGVTDCSRPTGCPPLPPAQVGLIYGLGLFTLGGTLVGGLASAPTRFRSWAGRITWAQVVTVVAFGTGMMAGVAIGLLHRYIGGPSLPPALPIDHVAGGIGLAGGLIGGLALGMVCAVLLNTAEQQPERNLLLFGGVLIVLGLVMWSLLTWFVPLTYIDIL